MPVVGIPVAMLRARLDGQPSREALVEHLQHLGCDVEGYATLQRFRCARCDNILEITESENAPVACERCGSDFRESPELCAALATSEVIRMELLAVRPDMFDPGGLARTLRSYLADEPRPAVYELAEPAFSVEVDAALGRPESFRPAIACGVIRGIDLDDDLIKALMKLQENLHWALGRDRKHASIGVYDLATLSGTKLRYRAVGPEELSFTPLGFDAQRADQKLTPREILERHPKGQSYARLVEGFDRYPLLEDESGQVLSLPPIINSEPTRVTPRTRELFIDVTGTGQRLVDRALNILVTSLAELARGARLERVTIHAGDRQERITPDLAPQQMPLVPELVSRVLGIEGLSRDEIARCLRRMGHGVDGGGARSKDARRLDSALGTPHGSTSELTVAVPAYRNDVLHPVDLVEDVAIAYGYHNIEPVLLETMTVGQQTALERASETCRGVMTGLGYFEVLTLLLSSEQQQFDALGLERTDDYVQIENPISVEQTMVRENLVAGQLDTLAANIDHEMPQRLFEVGNVSRTDEDAETGARERRRVAATTTGPRADYGEIRSACEALLREFGWQLEVRPLDLPLFIGGRGATVVAARAGERRDVGIAGEVHPEVLERFKLVQPVALFEVALDVIAEVEGAM